MKKRTIAGAAVAATAVTIPLSLAAALASWPSGELSDEFDERAHGGDSAGTVLLGHLFDVMEWLT